MNSTAEGYPKVDATRLSAERAALALLTQGLKRSPVNLKLFILVPNEGRKPQGVCPVLP
jgi:hypothetical protein